MQLCVLLVRSKFYNPDKKTQANYNAVLSHEYYSPTCFSCFVEKYEVPEAQVTFLLVPRKCALHYKVALV